MAQDEGRSRARQQSRENGVHPGYHEFSQPPEMMEAVFGALRPRGRLILVAYRGEDPNIPIKPPHKMSEAQVPGETEAVGLRWRANHGFPPQQHYIIFERP